MHTGEGDGDAAESRAVHLLLLIFIPIFFLPQDHQNHREAVKSMQSMESQFIDQDQNVVGHSDPSVGVVSTGNGCPRPQSQQVQSLLRSDPILEDQHHGMMGTGHYPFLTENMYTGIPKHAAGLLGHPAGLQGPVAGTHGSATGIHGNVAGTHGFTAGTYGHAANWSLSSQLSAVSTNTIGEGDRSALAEHFALESGNRAFNNISSLVPEANGGASSVNYLRSSSQSAIPNTLERHACVADFKPFQCRWEGCHYPRFSHTSCLWRHIQDKHVSPNQYPCTLCPEAFGRKDKLRKHVNDVHPDHQNSCT